MKNLRGLLISGLAVVAGSLTVASSAQAEPMNYALQAKAEETKYRTPEDLLDKIPFLGEIPRTFLLGDGYKMKLSADSLRIDHMGTRSRSRTLNQRNCMIGISYTTPVAGFFTTRVDLPILNAETPKWSDWSVSSLGDYVVYMSRTPAESAAFRLSISAKF